MLWRHPLVRKVLPCQVALTEKSNALKYSLIDLPVQLNGDHHLQNHNFLLDFQISFPNQRSLFCWPWERSIFKVLSHRLHFHTQKLSIWSKQPVHRKQNSHSGPAIFIPTCWFYFSYSKIAIIFSNLHITISQCPGYMDTESRDTTS